MTETAELDKMLRYLVPVARLDLPGQPDDTHLSLMCWNERLGDWLTGLALCGHSTTQGVLFGGVSATCRACEAYRPQYEAALVAEARAAEQRAAHRRRAAHEADTPENGAWFTVWLESGKWQWTTSKMTAKQREYAADCVAAYSRHLAAVDGDLERGEPDGLRWWREASR